ncbi:hypothetical protein [Streptomyces sp. CO7]
MDTGQGDSAGRAPAVNWQDASTLRWVTRPVDVKIAFDRGEPLVGVAVIALALNHHDADAILPQVARAMTADDPEIRRQGVVALAHVARLHRTVDQRCVDLLRGFPRGNEADDDLWSFVDHRSLPWWLRRYHAGRRLRWLVRDRWRG